MNYEQAEARAQILRAMAHPVRLIVLDALKDQDLCVGELNERVEVDQSTLSRHLATLRAAGIVTEHRDGVRAVQHLEMPCMLKTFECAETVLNSRFKAMRALVS